MGGATFPIPDPRVPALSRNTSCSRLEFSPSQPTLAHKRMEYIIKFLTIAPSISPGHFSAASHAKCRTRVWLVRSSPSPARRDKRECSSAVARAQCLARQRLLLSVDAQLALARFINLASRSSPAPIAMRATKRTCASRSA
jgi:hypothetical protein